MRSLGRSVLLPGHLIREYRTARALLGIKVRSEFDETYGVETEGDDAGWTRLSDLDLNSPHWFEGRDYAAIEPERFRRVLGALEINWSEYTFVDFGSGKGRALLLASELPFKRVIGLEFSAELHGVAEKNIALYRSESQKCRSVQSLNVDFVDFKLPNEPLVLFFFDPCRGTALEKTVAGIGRCLKQNEHSVYAIYVATGERTEELFRVCGFALRLQDREADSVIFERTACA